MSFGGILERSPKYWSRFLERVEGTFAGPVLLCCVLALVTAGSLAHSWDVNQAVTESYYRGLAQASNEARSALQKCEAIIGATQDSLGGQIVWVSRYQKPFDGLKTAP